MRAFLLVFCVAVMAMGCKKDSQSTTAKKDAGTIAVTGKWELRIQRGGLQPDKNFAAGNGNIVQFNADGTYAFYVADAVSKQGTFHVSDKLDLIYFDGDTAGEVMQLQNNTLTLGTSAADGPSYVYAKK